MASSVSLITGACGFVAPHLVKRILAQGDASVIGIDQWPKCEIPSIEYHQIDLLDSSALAQLLSRAHVTRVFHLAGISYLPDADATPRRALETNIIGTVSVLDAVHNASPSARVLAVGSSKEYGSGIQGESLPETHAANPTDFYGISKFAAELLGQQYVRQYGMDVRFTRSFNHTGPGQSPRFVCSDWARQAALIALDKAAPSIQVGNIEHDIDFSDVRDVVDAYFLILEKGQAGEAYNVCSGRPVPLQLVLDRVCARAGVPIQVVKQEQRLRSHTASPRLAGDNAKLRRHTGWAPKIPLEQTLDEMFDHWVGALRSAG
jgi:GDP-4-dehydro-6-deoxy-D-mannose reductase